MNKIRTTILSTALAGGSALGLAGVTDIAEASRPEQHHLIHDAGHELRTPLTSLRMNVEMLERAVNNLVSNADKFSPAGTSIDIVVRDGSVSVRDAGPGIPIAERSLVFGRFHRSETIRSMPGSGLGLSIVAQIVDVHGGEVWASESPGGGADVGFTLPIARTD